MRQTSANSVNAKFTGMAHLPHRPGPEGLPQEGHSTGRVVSESCVLTLPLGCVHKDLARHRTGAMGVHLDFGERLLRTRVNIKLSG
jgi:hypothetical protein